MISPALLVPTVPTHIVGRSPAAQGAGKAPLENSRVQRAHETRAPRARRRASAAYRSLNERRPRNKLDTRVRADVRMSLRRSRGGVPIWSRAATVSDVLPCAYCARSLVRHLAYVRCAAPACAKLDLRLCADCFSVGAATDPHAPAHPYRVVERLNAPIYQRGWTAEDERALLDALATHGPNNWHLVGRALGRSGRKCEEHYQAVYLDHRHAPLPSDTALVSQCSPPRRRRAAPSTTPEPQPPSTPCDDDETHCRKGSRRSTSAREMRARERARVQGNELLGYAPKRGDFDVEYDDEAEETIAELEIGEDDDEEAIDLKVRLLQIYNERLSQREAIKKLVVENKLPVSSLSAKKLRKAAAASRKNADAKSRNKVARGRVSRRRSRSTDQPDTKRAKIIRADVHSPSDVEIHLE